MTTYPTYNTIESLALVSHYSYLFVFNLSAYSVDDEVWSSISSVWEGIFDMMTAYLQVTGHTGWQQILPLLVNHWKIITGNFSF